MILIYNVCDITVRSQSGTVIDRSACRASPRCKLPTRRTAGSPLSYTESTSSGLVMRHSIAVFAVTYLHCRSIFFPP